MKIETRDDVRPEPPTARRQAGLKLRAAIAVALAGCLIVALYWALGITNANARQLSSNLTVLKDRIEKPGQGSRATDSQSARAGDGPTLEPADTPQ